MARRLIDREFVLGFISVFILVVILFGAAVMLIGASDQRGRDNLGMDNPQPRAFACQVVNVHDGDTFRCSDGTRVRLNGINARELDGSCGTGHPCPRASAQAARRTLEQLALGRRLECQRVGRSYNRVTAWCADERGRDLSCTMIGTRTVARWARFDPDRRLTRC